MIKNNNKKYDANFTAGGILFNEFTALEEILLSENFDECISIEEEENNVMGVAKAALEASTRYLANDLGQYDIT